MSPPSGRRNEVRESCCEKSSFLGFRRQTLAGHWFLLIDHHVTTAVVLLCALFLREQFFLTFVFVMATFCDAAPS